MGDVPLQSDASYTTVPDREFNSVTAENAMRWDAVEPTRGSFDWPPPTGWWRTPPRTTRACAATLSGSPTARARRAASSSSVRNRSVCSTMRRAKLRAAPTRPDRP
ncbi:endo-1,4-beta-xylanase [Streptomyces sp. NPDC051104]|uniref:endo-1,4-beta-xylanase n=1 Tax=Streptomyces sp. NPDC051104 TaxID=3155044 RepID=UPI00341F3C00